MQNKNEKARKINIKLIIVIIIALIAIVFVTINVCNNIDTNGVIGNSKAIDNEKILNGTYVYNDNVKYKFNGKGKGTLYDNQDAYEFVYKVNEQKLLLEFKEESISDSNYIFELNDNTLVLKGQEGTVGGVYELKKEN